MGAVLSDDEIEDFVRDGYVRVDQAFDSQLAARCVDVLWSMLPVDRSNPGTWTDPVIRIAGSTHPDLVAAINTARLLGVINDLLGGPDAWQPRSQGYGTFPVRFPSDVDPGDAGWHIDGSFGEAPFDRVNFVPAGSLLLLVLPPSASPPTRSRGHKPALVGCCFLGLCMSGFRYHLGRCRGGPAPSMARRRRQVRHRT